MSSQRYERLIAPVFPYYTLKLESPELNGSYEDVAGSLVFPKIEPSTDSTTSHRLVKEWHTACMQQHSACESAQLKKNWAPTRLVTFDKQSETVRIEKGVRTPVRYVALSHCWGNTDILTLTSANSQELAEEGVPMSCLPKTFRDAIHVCRWLNYYHLWIDSLCIQQDSHEDWTAEAHAMTDVYSNATLTIIAAHAANPTEGLFINRDPVAVMPPLIRCSWISDDNPQQLYTLVDSRMWLKGVDYCRLSKRAWTVQERFLSPRRLYFSKHQIFYACAAAKACEAFPVGKTPYQLGTMYGGSSLFSNSWVNSREIWSSVAGDYSRAALTKDTDKIIALSGVAEKMQHELKDEYVVGLWRSNLIHELLWRHSGTGGERYRPGPGRIAPSWSWMSVSGSAGVNINTTSCSSGATKCKHHVKIVYATVDKVDPARPTGDIFPGSGILQIQGQLKSASWAPVRRYGFCDWRKYQITFDGEVGSAFEDFRNNRTLTHPDLMDRSIFDKEIFLLPVKTSFKSENIESLLLTPVVKEACLYERIGHHRLDGINPLLFKERSKGKGENYGNIGWKDIAVTDIIII